MEPVSNHDDYPVVLNNEQTAAAEHVDEAHSVELRRRRRNMGVILRDVHVCIIYGSIHTMCHEE